MQIEDVFTDKDIVRQFLLHPILIDLSATPDDELATHGYIAPAEIALKHATQKPTEDTLIKLTSVIDECRQSLIASEPKFDESMLNVLSFLIGSWGLHINDMIQIIADHLEYYRSDVMGLAQALEVRLRDQWRHDDIKEGVQQGVKQGVKQGVVASHDK